MRDTEILVVGGGPAGSATARLLRQLGHQVSLVDAGPGWRHHLESLSPATWPVLESLGLRGEIQDARLAYPVESLVSWPDPEPPRPGWIVDRRRFDDRLLEAARAAGVTVIRPAMVRRPERGRGGWLVPIEASGARHLVRAGHVIDAGGRRSVLGGARTPSSLPLAALCGDLEDLPGPPRTVVEAGRDAWFWAATLPDGRGRAIAFLHPSREPGNHREAQLARRLAATRLLAPLLRGRLVRVSVTDASSWHSPLVEDRAIKIGDAACCIDPIASQGIQSALVSAIKAAAVVHTLRTGGDAAAARALYRLHVEGTARTHARLSAQHYARGGAEAFWRDRAGTAAGAARPPAGATIAVDDSTRLWLQPGVARVEVPSLDGMVIRRGVAVTAPALDGPVMFVDGIAVAPLIELLRGGETARDIALRWASRVGAPRSARLLAWSLRMGVLAARPATSPPETHEAHGTRGGPDVAPLLG